MEAFILWATFESTFPKKEASKRGTDGHPTFWPASNHCNLREAGPTIHPTNLALTQVAVIAASCCVGHICMVGGGGGCSCMLLLYPVPTSADAAPDLCTLCPDLCTLHLDLWTLCLWCFPSFNWCKHSTCTAGG